MFGSKDNTWNVEDTIPLESLSAPWSLNVEESNELSDTFILGYELRHIWKDYTS
jgi:hypothetical protein